MYERVKIEKKTIRFLPIIYGITIIYVNNVKAIETGFTAHTKLANPQGTQHCTFYRISWFVPRDGGKIMPHSLPSQFLLNSLAYNG